MIDQSTVAAMSGATVRDSAGEKIGKVNQVYLDDQTGTPEWVTVRTGLFGGKESFVPLADADMQGDDLVITIDKATVSGAPQVDEDGHLSEEQETELYRYYEVSPGAFGQDTGPTGYATTAAATGPSTDTSSAQTGTTGYEGTAATAPAGTADQGEGPTTDDATTGPAEQGTQRAEAARARLRRYVGAEQVELDDAGTRRDPADPPRPGGG
jgi:sporulation protein YlmC with PRC-barrel domain